MFNWFWKRVFSQKNIGYMIKNAQPHIQEEMNLFVKNSIITTINDPEVGQWITALGDGLYDRYMQKVTGFIGGKQKGINFATDQAVDDMNPLSGIISQDDDGNMRFNLMGAIKTFMSGGFKGMGSGGSPTPASPNMSGGIPPMRRLSDR